MPSQFVYQIDFTGKSQPTDLNVTNNLPIINDGASFTSLSNTISVNGSVLTVTVNFVYTDNNNNDGLSFSNVTSFFNNYNTIVTQFGNIPVSRGGSQFSGITNIIFTTTDTPSFLTGTSLETCFYNCRNFNSNISSWNTTNVVNMNAMFQNATPFNQPVNTWTVSNVTDMGAMFQNATSFNQPINNWNVSNVTDMNNMFNSTTSFNQDLSGWNVGNVTNMQFMFTGATSFNSDIGSWNVSKVTSMRSMFFHAICFNYPLNNWNVSNVTDMRLMFASNGLYQPMIFNQNITSWNTGNVTNMSGMFQNNTSFNQPIGNWDVSKVQNIGGIFTNTFFNQAIGNWNVSSVSNTTNMFQNNTVFNQPIGNWNTSSFRFMDNMFNNTTGFNQDISNWNTSNATSMYGVFDGATSFNKPLNTWNTTNVTRFTNMFRNATSFNQNISNWNVGNVTNMSSMFTGATAFSPLQYNTNLDKILNTWSSQTVRSGVTLNAPLAYYDNTGISGYNTLVSKGWTINALYSNTVCFLEGSKILCFINNTEEYIPIEEIQRGTLVKTCLNGYKAVELIGHSKLYNPGNSLRNKDRLYKYTPKNYPELTEDLIITGGHSTLVDELTDKQKEESFKYRKKLTKTEEKFLLLAVVDEKTEPYTEEGIHTIWHLALENEDPNMNYGCYANGLLVETVSKNRMKELSGMELV